MQDARTSAPSVAVGVVLAGGEARRMGRDKRLLRLDGVTLLERNLRLLQQLFPTVAVSVRDAGQITDPLPAGVQIVPDTVTGSPLAGIASVLAHFSGPVFVLAADVAFADRTAVQTVLDAFVDVDVALPVAEDHLEPLHAVYGPDCLTHIRRLLEKGARSILDLFPLVRVARVPFPDPAPFFNVNTPADWAEARRRLGGDADALPHEGAPARRADGPVILGVVGRPNSGKTTLIKLLILQFNSRGLRVGAVKRVARFDIDVPGKDSWRHGQAGADAYTVASASKLAFIARRDEEASLEEIVARYFSGYDVVVCEGYRREAPYIVEVFRAAAGYESPVCAPDEPLALVTDAGLDHEHRFGLDDSAALAAFLVERLGLVARA